MTATIRIFAQRVTLGKYDDYVRSLLVSNALTVLDSHKVTSVYELYSDQDLFPIPYQEWFAKGNYTKLQKSDYAILFVVDTYTDREKIITWLQSMISDVVVMATFTYVILSTHRSELIAYHDTMPYINLKYWNRSGNRECEQNKLGLILTEICEDIHSRRT